MTLFPILRSVAIFGKRQEAGRGHYGTARVGLRSVLIPPSARDNFVDEGRMRHHPELRLFGSRSQPPRIDAYEFGLCEH
jgi:hypothetical protein